MCIRDRAISKFNQHPFIVLTVIAIAVGLVCKIPTEEVINTVKSGFGNILASIGIVIPVSYTHLDVYKRQVFISPWTDQNWLDVLPSMALASPFILSSPRRVVNRLSI